MKRIWLVVLLLLPGTLRAQGSNNAAGNLTAASASCLATNCVSLRYQPNTIYATITLSGTWSATVQFEVSGDYGVTWVAAPGTTSSTSNGTTQFTVGGYTMMRARVSAFTSGTVSVTVIGSTQSVSTTNITNTGGGSSGAVSGTIDPTLAPYNAPLTNTCIGTAVTVTSASANVSCSNASFTSADIGKSIWATCCGINGAAAKYASVMYLGTFGSAPPTITAIVSGTTVTTSATASNSCSSNTGCVMMWGFDATTQLSAAITAAWGTPGPCKTLHLSGVIQTKTGQGNGTPLACTSGLNGPADYNFVVIGNGRVNTHLLIRPDFNFATCTGVGTLPTCFFGMQGMERLFFDLWGGEISNTGTHSVALIGAEADDFDWDVGLTGFGAQDLQMIGYEMDGPGAYPNFVVVDGAGGTGIQANPPVGGSTLFLNYLEGCFSGDTKGISVASAPGNVRVVGSASLESSGCKFGYSPSGTGTVTVETGGQWFSDNDEVLGQAGVAAVHNKGTVHMTNFKVKDATQAQGIWNNGGTAYITNSQLQGATNPVLNDTSGIVFVDDETTFSGAGTNSGLAPTCTFTTGGGGTPSCTLQAGSTNGKGAIIASTGTAPGSSGTITLTFAGTFAGGSGATPACTYTLDNSGTAWGAEAVVFANTQSTTAPTSAWTNIAALTTTALTASSPYRIAYTCVPR